VDLAKIRKKAKKREASARERSQGVKPEKNAPEAEPSGPPPLEPPAEVAAAAPERTAAEERVATEEMAAPERGREPETEPGRDVLVKIETPSQPEPETVQKSKDKKLEKLLVFKVGRNRYAIPIDDLSQIIDDRALTPLPHVPPFLKGIFSLRGHIVGVLDVSERLNLPPLPESVLRKIVVLEKGGDLFGLRVENIEHVVEVDISSLEAPPESFDSAQQEFVVGVFHYKNKTVAFLNLQMFLEFNVAGRS